MSDEVPFNEAHRHRLKEYSAEFVKNMIAPEPRGEMSEFTLKDKIRFAKLALCGLRDPAIVDILPGAARVADEVSDLLDELWRTMEAPRCRPRTEEAVGTGSLRMEAGMTPQLQEVLKDIREFLDQHADWAVDAGPMSRDCGRLLGRLDEAANFCSVCSGSGHLPSYTLAQGHRKFDQWVTCGPCGGTGWRAVEPT